jgi:uncharacterized protein (TIGR02145 family)
VVSVFAVLKMNNMDIKSNEMKCPLIIACLIVMFLYHFEINLSGQVPNQTITEVTVKAQINSDDSLVTKIVINTEVADSLPDVITGVITLVGITNATISGRIISDNRSLVTSYGLCWYTKPNPTINDYKIIVNSDSGNFLCKIAGLLPNTLYFIRTYATAGKDTVYGEGKAFYTHKQGSVADIDGNYYNAVKIGTQVWLAEDLKTTRFNDGTPINRVADASLWGKLTTPGWCWYANDSVEYSFPRGKLYNWYTINSGKLCPTGWHVPSDTAWKTLQHFLGGDSIAGGKLKAYGTIFWRYPNHHATNESGFSAIPGGYRNSSGVFSYSSIFDKWWSSNGIGSEATSYWYVYHATSYLYQNISLRMMGYSVRCLKDQ